MLKTDGDLVSDVTVKELLMAREAYMATAVFLGVVFRVGPGPCKARAAVNRTTELAVLHLGLGFVAAGAGCGRIRPFSHFHVFLVYLFGQLEDHIGLLKLNIDIVYTHTFHL